MTTSPLPTCDADAVPWLTVGQMREVDRIMVDELGILLIQMMENAGRNLAVAARTLLAEGPAGSRVAVIAGPGGNGGGGMVAARHLAVAGALVTVHTTVPVSGLSGVPQHQARALERMGLRVEAGPAAAIGEANLVIDAVLGYSLDGPPRGVAADLIAAAGRVCTLALDTPSGLDLSTGMVHPGAIRAEATVTLAAPKEGLRTAEASENVGRLLLADISVPPAVYARLGAAVAPDFAAGPLLAVRR